MYLDYFGLECSPFDGAPDRRFFYVGGAQHQALGLIATALARSGSLCVLTGPAQSGKTLLVRMLLKSLPKRMLPVFMEQPHPDAEGFLRVLLRESGVPLSATDDLAQLRLKVDYMLECARSRGIVTTVIIDDAQALKSGVLDEIRRLFTERADPAGARSAPADGALNFLLIGDGAFEETLNSVRHADFKACVRVMSELPYMSEQESSAYISYRLQQAGCKRQLFSPRALKLIHKKSRGMPPLVNDMAHVALDLACERRKDTVDGFTASKASQLVLYNSSGPQRLFKALLRELSSVSVYLKCLTAAFAFLCAVAGFFSVFYIAESAGDYAPRTLQLAVLSDQDIQRQYDKLSKALFTGRRDEGRTLYLFNRAVNQASFRTQAMANLLKIRGYAVSDSGDGVISDALLKSVSLQSLDRTGPLSEALSFNTPVLISLTDDSLTPFYCVLLRLNDDVAQLLIGSYLFDVRLPYIRERYQGRYTILHPYIGNLDDLSSRKTDVRKAMQNELKSYLQQYLDMAQESNSRDLKITQDQLNDAIVTVKTMEDALAQQIRATMKTAREQNFDKAFAEAKKNAPALNARINAVKILKGRLAEKIALKDRLRGISLKLDGGFEKAVALYLGQQGLRKFDAAAAARLVLLFDEDARHLIDVVPLGSAALKEGEK